MADSTFLQKKQGTYLWYGLQQLGFEPNLKNQGSRKPVDLGPDMFRNPNRDAFHVVILFLLKKLNARRVEEEYRYCWPVRSPKDDAEFRKQTCAWVKEILGNKALPSLFLSPGGPKFISLMLDLVQHIMLQEIKSVKTDGSWLPETVILPSSSLHMAKERLKVVQRKFIRAAEEQMFFISEYEKQVQELVEAKTENAAEAAYYEELIERFNSNSRQEGLSLVEEAEKARSTFAAINRMVAVTDAKQESVETAMRIIENRENVLDADDIDLQIPPGLRQRVEKLPHQLSSGNVYKDEKLDFLALLELSHSSLELHLDERRQHCPSAESTCQPEDLEEAHEKITSTNQNLQGVRDKLTLEKIPELRDVLRELEMAEDRRWGDVPLDSFLEDSRVLDFQSIVDHLSFESDSAAYSKSIFSLYPATLLDVKYPESEEEEKSVQPVPLNPINSPPAPDRAASPTVSTKTPLTVNTSLACFLDSPPAASPPSPLSPPSPPTPPTLPETSVMKTAPSLPKVTPFRTKAQILDLECDTLADQLAEAVTSAKPADGSRTGAEFKHLLNTLHDDPFSARKQIPRTPESLLDDVRSSWRKVLEEDNKSKKGDQSVKLNSFNTSITTTSRMSPLPESPPSLPDTPSPPKAPVTPTVPRQTSPPKFSLLWDSAVQFSLEDETLPEMPGCDSLLSLDGKEEEEDEDENEVVLRHRLNEESPQTGRGHVRLQQEQLLSPFGLLSEPVEEKNFSLDLDKLETPKRTSLGLPQLINFSPFDDM